MSTLLLPNLNFGLFAEKNNKIKVTGHVKL